MLLICQKLQTFDMFCLYFCDKNGSITEATVKTHMVLPLLIEASKLEPGRSVPDAESVVLPELQKHRNQIYFNNSVTTTLFIIMQPLQKIK